MTGVGGGDTDGEAANLPAGPGGFCRPGGGALRETPWASCCFFCKSCWGQGPSSLWVTLPGGGNAPTGPEPAARQEI